jgi:hypothetical protein
MNAKMILRVSRIETILSKVSFVTTKACVVAYNQTFPGHKVDYTQVNKVLNDLVRLGVAGKITDLKRGVSYHGMGRK